MLLAVLLPINRNRPITFPLNKRSPELRLGDYSYRFTNLLHRFVPGQELFQNIRICQERHA